MFTNAFAKATLREAVAKMQRFVATCSVCVCAGVRVFGAERECRSTKHRQHNTSKRAFIKYVIIIELHWLELEFYVINCPINGTQYTVHGTRYTIHNARYTKHETRYTIPDTRYTITDSRCTLLNDCRWPLLVGRQRGATIRFGSGLNAKWVLFTVSRNRSPFTVVLVATKR